MLGSAIFTTVASRMTISCALSTMVNAMPGRLRRGVMSGRSRTAVEEVGEAGTGGLPGGGVRQGGVRGEPAVELRANRRYSPVSRRRYPPVNIRRYPPVCNPDSWQPDKKLVR